MIMKMYIWLIATMMVGNGMYAQREPYEVHFDGYGGDVSTPFKTKEEQKEQLKKHFLQGKGWVTLEDVWVIANGLLRSSKREISEAPSEKPAIVVLAETPKLEGTAPSLVIAAQEKNNPSFVPAVAKKSYIQQFKEASTPVQCVIVTSAVAVAGGAIGGAIYIGKKGFSK